MAAQKQWAALTSMHFKRQQHMPAPAWPSPSSEGTACGPNHTRSSRAAADMRDA